jgi:hypothetical protein
LLNIILGNKLVWRRELLNKKSFLTIGFVIVLIILLTFIYNNKLLKLNNEKQSHIDDKQYEQVISSDVVTLKDVEKYLQDIEMHCEEIEKRETNGDFDGALVIAGKKLGATGDSLFEKLSSGETWPERTRYFTRNEINLNNIDNPIIAIDLVNQYKNTGKMLIFNKYNGEYCYIGSIDYGDFFSEKHASFEVIDNWIVVKKLVGRGTGEHIVNEIWYRIENNKIVKDLEYLSDAWIDLPPSYDFPIQVYEENKKIISDDDSFVVKVNYEVSFVIYNNYLKSKDNKVTVDYANAKTTVEYSWDFENKRFDPSRFKEVEDWLYEVHNLNADVFEKILQENYEKLKTIAQNGDEMDKQYLNHLLKRCKDGKNKSNIMKLIEQQN